MDSSKDKSSFPKNANGLPIYPYVEDVFKRSSDEEVLNGLFEWKKAAKFIRKYRPGVKIYSGTSPVERLWAEIDILGLTRNQTNLSNELFEVVMNLLFLRIIRGRLLPKMPTTFKRDNIIANAFFEFYFEDLIQDRCANIFFKWEMDNRQY